MIEAALARASLYNFFAAVFGDLPTPELLAALQAVVPEVSGVTLDELRQAYTATLVGPGAKFTPPYASIYLESTTGAKPLLWGGEAVMVEGLYRKAGLEIAPGQPRVPDHLALELQFMQHLCSRQADALARGEAATALDCHTQENDFLRHHLLTWLPLFVERLAGAGAHPVYLKLAELALAFAQWNLENHEIPFSGPSLQAGLTAMKINA